MRISPQVIEVFIRINRESDILAKQDINDEDNDGISGLARIVNDEKGNKKIGRFGIRASTPNYLLKLELLLCMTWGSLTL